MSLQTRLSCSQGRKKQDCSSGSQGDFDYQGLVTLRSDRGERRKKMQMGVRLKDGKLICPITERNGGGDEGENDEVRDSKQGGNECCPFEGSKGKKKRRIW